MKRSWVALGHGKLKSEASSYFSAGKFVLQKSL